MSDAISRDAVIKCLERGDTLSSIDHRLIDKIKRLPSVTQKSGKWIPVNERLPEEFESVLVCYKSQGGMAQAVSERFGTHTGYRWSALAGIKPIAWMPLPEPYMVDSQGLDKNDKMTIDEAVTRFTEHLTGGYYRNRKGNPIVMDVEK